MTNWDKIDSCEHLFITQLYEPGQNQLAIEITLGQVSDFKQEFSVEKTILGGQRIFFDDQSEKYIVVFDSYIAYYVLNERYDMGIDGEYIGCRMREYSQSAFIDFCKKETTGFSLHDLNTLRHFVIVTQNHIVNIITISSPEVRPA